MIHVIIYQQIEERIKTRTILLGTSASDVIALDDMNSTLQGLEGYAYPSLFSVGVPIVHAKYLLEVHAHELNDALLNTLVKSSTIYILEERDVSAGMIKQLQKCGVTVHSDKDKKKSTSKQPGAHTVASKPTIFSVTVALTSKSKKERWMVFHEALQEHAIEAILGILYWKLRTLIEGSPQNAHFKKTYTSLIRAHAQAWQDGTTLALSIEKVILEL